MNYPEVIVDHLSPQECAEVLRDHGFSIGAPKLCAWIESGTCPFGFFIQMKNREYIILKKDFVAWLQEHGVPAEEWRRKNAV